jgi:hypothetical protein
MISKNNRRNTDFQIDNFLVGSCHTADGAYSLLCDLREDREAALSQVTVSELRTRAKIARAEASLRSEDEATRLEAEADIEEIRSNAAMLARNIAAARAELAHIDDLIARLQPHRRYAHLPDPQAHEAAQREEWRLELAHRAENFLLTSGTIPHDHFASMRQHPDFERGILPVIEHTKTMLAEGRVDALLLAPRPAFLALEAPDVCTD